ncbi:MAG: CBS domain-containing protein [Rubrivivax sp.]|nr:MAG: CBS domain-containing protein [Rubrivivax sp.]
MALAPRFKPLELASLNTAPGLPQTQRQAHPEDPAMGLLTDLSHSACVVASHQDSLESTLHVMRRAGVRMVFVAGSDGQLAGIVTADLLHGERPVLRASNAQVAHRELSVADVMIPITHWETIDLAQVRTARLGDIVATLHEHGMRYLLVTQTKDGRTTLRGLFSATRLEQALGTPIGSDLHSRSFAELEAVLAH